MFPWHLFRIDARDEQSSVFSVWSRVASITDTTNQAFNLSFDPIDNDQILVLTNFVAYGIPESGMYTTFLQQRVDPLASSSTIRYSRTATYLANDPLVGNWDGVKVVMPGEFLTCRFGFSLAPVGAGHLAQMWASGLLLPRGNALQG